MIVLSDMVKDIVFQDGYSDREKVLLLKKLMEPELKVDVYTERLANLCDADRERAKERAERRREQNRLAQQRYRESHDERASEPVSKVSVRKQASAGVSKSKQSKRLTDTDTDADSIYQKENINRPDSDTRAGACARGEAAAARNARIPAWTMSDDELMSGVHPVVAILRAAMGNGCWRKAVMQLGDAQVLGEFAAFRAEIRAGEGVRNRAAAFTARLVRCGFRPGEAQHGGSGAPGSPDAPIREGT